MSYFGIFRLKYEKNIIIFEITKIRTNKKNSNLGPTISYLGILDCYFENYCHMSNLLSQICEDSWFDAKTKALNLGPKVLV